MFVLGKAILVTALLLTLASAASAQEVPFDERACTPDAPAVPSSVPEPETETDPLTQRLLRYAELHVKHRVQGLASYYSTFFDGRKTANGEIYRNRRYSAAHLTLPLGCWVEVKSRATGKKLRLRVNDRGPYVKKFAIDLSQAAARYLGVDKHPDRHVEFRVIALPGEEPLPEDYEESLTASQSHGLTERAATASMRP